MGDARVSADNSLAVHLAAMRDPKHQDHEDRILNFIDDTKDTYSDSIAAFVRSQFLNTRRPGVGGKSIERGADANLMLSRESFQVALSSGAQFNPVDRSSQSEIGLDLFPRDILARLSERRVRRRVIDPVLFLLA